jgi:hypothetical protein
VPGKHRAELLAEALRLELAAQEDGDHLVLRDRAKQPHRAKIAL